MTTAARKNLCVDEQALRLAFLDFTHHDAARLRELHPFAERQQMGGIIWVDSSEGQGATFYFTLPRSEAKSAES